MQKCSPQVSRMIVLAGLLIALGAPGCAPHRLGKIRVTAERIDFYDKVRFESKQAVILPESHRLLDAIGAAIKERPNLLRIRICGHTDNRGSRTENLKLSQARAEAVRQYLITGGIAAERLVAVGYGENRPLASNRTESGRERNRRVEFVIVKAE